MSDYEDDVPFELTRKETSDSGLIICFKFGLFLDPPPRIEEILGAPGEENKTKISFFGGAEAVSGTMISLGCFISKMMRRTSRMRRPRPKQSE
jgi:hypothetical protein